MSDNSVVSLQDKNAPQRVISLFGLTMVSVGACIGAGIFFVPQSIAGYLSSPLLIILIWILGTVVGLFGALTYAELGVMFTGTGGQYEYLKQTYGPFWGFTFSWLYITIINPGAIASLSIVFATYFLNALGIEQAREIMGLPIISVIAVSVILFTTIVNTLSAKISEYFTSFFTVMKLIGMAIIIFIGLMWGAEKENLKFTFENVSFVNPDLNLLSALGLAFVGVWFSSSGWQHASYLAGEVKNPARYVPIAMILGSIIVGIFYVTINLSYISLLPTKALYESQCVAADAVSTVTPYGALMLAIIICISTIGTIAICTFSAPRLAYAVAEDKLFFQSFSKIHPKFKTPFIAIFSQGIIAIVFLIAGKTFLNIITSVVFADVVLTTLTGLAVVILRKTKSEVPRKYRVLGYPVTTGIFILVMIIFAIITVVQTPLNAAVGLGAIIAGYPVYYYFKTKNW